MTYTLPDLPYDYAALEPVISREIMELHHGKHHRAYVNNLNAALDQYATADLSTQIALEKAIKFNGGGHINHSIFWTNLAPKGIGGGNPVGPLSKAIDEKWGSFDHFVKKFNAKALAIQGSGWCWLAYHPECGQIRIVAYANQDPCGIDGWVPLLGVDVWEHAYYLQYKNARADYLAAIWQIVNWPSIGKRYEAALSGTPLTI